MPGKTQEINIHIREFHRNLAYRLHRIRVEQSAVLVSQFRQFRNRVDVAGFVVCPHHGNNRRFIINHLSGALHVQTPLPVNGNQGNTVAAAFQFLAQIQHRGMFHFRRHDFVALGTIHQSAENRRAVALRSA